MHLKIRYRWVHRTHLNCKIISFSEQVNTTIDCNLFLQLAMRLHQSRQDIRQRPFVAVEYAVYSDESCKKICETSSTDHI